MDTVFGMEAIGFWIVVTGALVNICGALLGNYLVLRRMSMLGDAISHAVLPGLALAFLLTGTRHPIPMLVGAAIAGLLTVLLTELIRRFGRVNEDASIGVVFTSMFALGVVLISRGASKVDIDADCVLYGILESAALDTVPVFGVDIPQVSLNLGVMTIVVLLFVVLLWKELKLVSFDPALATSIGINATLVHYLLMFMVAAFTVVAFEAVGSILVVAMMIVPSATAYLLTDRLKWMALIAVSVGILSSVFGRIAANHFETSAAGMMAVAAGALFALAVLFAPRYGYLAKRIFHLRTEYRIAREDILALLFRFSEQRPNQALPLAKIHEAGGDHLMLRLTLYLMRFTQDVQLVGEALRLTEKGAAAGAKLIRKHRLWESWLAKHSNLALDHLHDPAHRAEHFIHDDVATEIADDVGSPESDPHGKPILGDQNTR